MNSTKMKKRKNKTNKKKQVGKIKLKIRKI